MNMLNPSAGEGEMVSAAKALEHRFSDLSNYQTRLKYLNRLESRGWPTRRNEAWTYTDFGALLGGPGVADPSKWIPPENQSSEHRRASPDKMDPELFTVQAVLVDGRLCQTASRGLDGEGWTVNALGPDDAKLCKPLDAVLDEDSTADFHRAWFTSAIRFSVKAGCTAPPLCIRSVAGGRDIDRTSLPRIIIEMGDGAQASVLEWVDDATGLPALKIGIVSCNLARNARLNYIQFSRTGDLARVTSDILFAELSENSAFELACLNLGRAGLARTRAHAKLNETGASAVFKSLVLASGGSHFDHTFSVQHLAPACESKLLCRQVLSDTSQGVFQGKFIVGNEAQKTDANMMARGLMLSPNAAFSCKPELEIFADDVWCGHGVTTASLDDQSLFYLRSRGIPKAVSQRMLIRSFLLELMEGIGPDRWQPTFDAQIQSAVSEMLAPRAGT